jgi:hypothetical protein
VTVQEFRSRRLGRKEEKIQVTGPGLVNIHRYGYLSDGKPPRYKNSTRNDCVFLVFGPFTASTGKQGARDQHLYVTYILIRFALSSLYLSFVERALFSQSDVPCKVEVNNRVEFVLQLEKARDLFLG